MKCLHDISFCVCTLNLTFKSKMENDSCPPKEEITKKFKEKLERKEEKLNSLNAIMDGLQDDVDDLIIKINDLKYQIDKIEKGHTRLSKVKEHSLIPSPSKKILFLMNHKFLKNTVICSKKREIR